MKIVHVDLDDTLCRYTQAKEVAIAKTPGNAFPQCQYGFYRNLKPMPHAAWAMRALLASEEYTPYILTAPSIHNPLSYTEKREWVENHLGFEFVDRLIICAHKNLLRGDILIDDNVSGKGQDKFEGRLIQFGSLEYPDWIAITEHLGVY